MKVSNQIRRTLIERADWLAAEAVKTGDRSTRRAHLIAEYRDAQDAMKAIALEPGSMWSLWDEYCEARGLDPRHVAEACIAHD